MTIKKNAAEINTGSFLYDLFEGGYINPSKYLNGEDLKKVKAAIVAIKKFEQALDRAGVLNLI